MMSRVVFGIQIGEDAPGLLEHNVNIVSSQIRRVEVNGPDGGRGMTVVRRDTRGEPPGECGVVSFGSEIAFVQRPLRILILGLRRSSLPQRRMSDLAQSGHFATEFQCPLLGVKRTWVGHSKSLVSS